MITDNFDSDQQKPEPTKESFPLALPQGYHLDNFLVLIQDISRRYQDLLTEEERLWIKHFVGLSSEGKSLLVRLIMRKGPFFRCDKLNYDDIQDLTATQLELADKHFIAINGDIPISSLLALGLKAELSSIATHFIESKSNVSKAKLMETLSTLSADDLDTKKKLVLLFKQHFEWIERRHDHLIRRFLILFFGNSRQGLTEFVTAQLGIIQYEAYPLEQENRFFQNRRRLDHSEQLAIIQDWQDECLTSANVNDIQMRIDQLIKLIKDSEHEDHYIHQKTQRVLTRFARQLERLDPEKALPAYQYSLAPPSRERQARILEKQGHYQDALALIDAIEALPQHPDEAEKTTPLKTKLLKRLGKKAERHQSIPATERHLQLPAQDPNKTIEQQVADYFITQDRLCLHTENQLFLGLFGLFFWDIIFMPCKDAFYNAYQLGPRDLWDQHFVIKREKAVQARLSELKTSTQQWQQRLLTTIETKQGIANYFVNWQRFDQAFTELLCNHIPAEHLHAIFTQILQNPGYYRNGFPDLLLITDERYELWEVKGPTDSLQTNQKRWLSFFQNHKIPAGVLHVTWGDNG